MLDRQLSPRAVIALLLLSLVGLAGLVAFLLGGEGGPPPDKVAPLSSSGTATDAELADFVGDQVCASCHPAIARAHRRSRHAITLHRMLPGHLPRSLPDYDRFADPATDLQYALERRHDRYFFRVVTPAGSRSQAAEFAFGSGKTGITLVGRAEAGTLREFRMSYFPFRRRWEVTPGQRGPATDPLGHVHERAMAQRCFSCHSTVVTASQIVPEPRFMNVGCEACHGPGRRHIEALEHGDPAPHIDNPGGWDGQRVNALCGHCHRTERELDPLDTFPLSQTQRFQPLGLAKSACFRQSAGHLSCVTCHDAHEDARVDPAHYEAVCLSCHHAKKAGVQVFRSSGVQETRPEHLNTRTPEHLNTVCPVNPRSGCITCHMPNREVVRGISMADHWIRVFRSTSAGGRQR
jgi:hypothetical protein